VERRLRNPYWRISHDVARSLVRLSRTNVAFPAIADLVSSVGEVAAALDALGRKTIVLLVDLRDGPMRTDAAFETAMAAERPRLLRDIPKVGILVRTPLGKMQLSRHQREGTIAWTTFNDEGPALAHLGVKLG
jgi:hypothetical protein